MHPACPAGPDSAWKHQISPNIPFIFIQWRMKCSCSVSSLKPYRPWSWVGTDCWHCNGIASFEQVKWLLDAILGSQYSSLWYCTMPCCAYLEICPPVRKQLEKVLLSDLRLELLPHLKNLNGTEAMRTGLTSEKWVKDELWDISHVILPGLSGVPAVTSPPPSRLQARDTGHKHLWYSLLCFRW